jgi:catechol 2,3-dioxygenase-like lactoylglutathione lyase family enzyme
MADDDLPASARGMVLTVLLIVADQDRSPAFYQGVLGAKVVLERDPCILRFHNSWIVLKVGGGPTQDKPTVTMAAAHRSRHRQLCPEHPGGRHPRRVCEWRARGARFLTPPLDRGREIRCYLRDPDGHLIEVGQTT